MKAVVCTKYGSPDVLKLAQVEKPLPKCNEILIKIYATSVTAGDVRIRSFNIPALFRLPMGIMFGFRKPRNPIIGMELSGEIEAVGKDVTRFKQGERVFAPTGLSGFATYAEYKCLREDKPIGIKPVNMSYEEAATISNSAITALHFLRKAKIQKGQKVLIYGASGSMGTYAVQLAKYYGAEVTGVCSGVNLNLVKSLGADKVIDYTKDDFSNNGETYDVIFDTVDKTSFSDCLRSLNNNGFYLSGAAASLSAFIQAALASLTSSKTVLAGPASVSSKDFNFLKGLVESGHIKAVMDRSYPLEQIVEAHRYVDTGRKKGNVAITIR